ncbi:MAG TPA: CBS domain-containing protein [Thermoanaerobaculia bacterium]|nr:CBS domain-containing protein [Thermoanaerobaculia bacterium]
MLVKDVMTLSPICCKPSDTLDRVAAMMEEHGCGVVPVCDDRKLVGIVTDRDITCRTVALGKTPAVVPVSDMMTRTVFTIRQNDDVQAAIELMEAKQVRRLPVVDDQGNVVGIVAPSDLAPTFASTDVADFLLAVSYWTRRPAVSPAAS